MSSSSLFLLTAIGFNVLTSTFFKWSSFSGTDGSKSNLLFIIGLLFGFINAYCYTRSLKTLNLNVAYPIFSMGSYAVLSLVSYFFFEEHFNLTKLFGMFLLIGGIYFISRG